MDWFGVCVLLVLSLPLVALALRRTRVWWLPGVSLLVGAGALLTQFESTQGDVGGLTAFANGIVCVGSFMLATIGVCALALGSTNAAARRERAAERARHRALARATVVVR